MTTPGSVRVLIFLDTDDESGLIEAYDATSEALQGVAGLIGNELLRGARPGQFAVMSEWTDQDSFARWESSAGHRAATAPVRPFQDSRLSPPFAKYEIIRAW